jgi:hypothetical protein
MTGATIGWTILGIIVAAIVIASSFICRGCTGA